MKKITLFLLLSAFIVLFACKSNKDMVQDKATMETISFGSGGGFAGAFTQYNLYESGLIEVKKSMNDSFQTCNTVEKAVCEQLFSSIKTLNLATKTIDDPGNMYYFLKVKDGESMVEFQWGGVNAKVDPAVKNYYNLLTSLAKRKILATE